MSIGWWLFLWTGIGFTWWIVSLWLVVSGRPGRSDSSVVPDTRRISVFKPMARLEHGEFEGLRPGLESFVAALDDDSELILGCHECNEPEARAFLSTMRAKYPRADLKLVSQRHPDGLANPKISWNRILATHATGELWLWSDADMEAPSHALGALRSEFAETKAGLLTAPYVMRPPSTAPGWLDAFFVNVEFYPGALLLGRLNLVRFGFGSGMLFEAARFRRVVDWDDLGSYLAEDFHLGRLLAPSRLGKTCFVTTPAGQTWRDALLHYLRWHKTIRWCRPGSHAAQLIVLPLLGWLAALLVQPTRPEVWIGLCAVVLGETLTAALIFRALGSAIPRVGLLLLPAWSLLRVSAWIACWLPWPIVWRGRRWWTPRRDARPRDETLEAESRVRVE